MNEPTPDEADRTAAELPTEVVEQHARQVLPVSVEFIRRQPRRIGLAVLRKLERERLVKDPTAPAVLAAEVKRVRRRVRDLKLAEREARR